MLPLHNSPSMNLNTTTEEYVVEWCVWLNFIAHLATYIAVLVLILIAVLMIIKYVSEIGIDDSNEDEEPRPTETSPLCNTQNVAAALAYRSEDNHQDLESGNCESSDESDDELYDRKLCVICYDEQRNCFFVPCGHCATCHGCAKRIFSGENNNCPVCRQLIDKVGRLLAP